MTKNKKTKAASAPSADSAKNANASASAETTEVAATAAEVTAQSVTVAEANGAENAEGAAPPASTENTEPVATTATPPVLTEGAESETEEDVDDDDDDDELIMPTEQPETSRPLWTNFNESPQSASVQAMNAALAKKAEQKKKDAELVLLKGFGRFQCLRDNGSGKYRQGRVYVLPVGQHPELFRKVD